MWSNVRLLTVGIVALSISGCISTQEMPLAPNAVRLDTHASGLLSVGQTVPQTMRRAAQLTLDAGYTHFKLQDVNSQQGEKLAGVYSTSSGSVVATGYGGVVAATGTSSGLSVPIRRRTADVGVTVIMFHAADPGAKDAFDAAEVLKKYSQ